MMANLEITWMAVLTRTLPSVSGEEKVTGPACMRIKTGGKWGKGEEDVLEGS